MYPGHLGPGHRVNFVDLPANGQPLVGYTHQAVAQLMAARGGQFDPTERGGFWPLPSDLVQVFDSVPRAGQPVFQGLHQRAGQMMRTHGLHAAFPHLALRERANPYMYALNNPVIYTDPSGMAVVVVGAATLAVVGAFLACTLPQFNLAHSRFPASSDDFKHCWVSCRISKSCGVLVTQVAGLTKEVRDSAYRILGWSNEPWMDSIDDIIANQKCLYWEQYVFGLAGSWIGGLCRESCEDCCRREVGFN